MKSTLFLLFSLLFANLHGQQLSSDSISSLVDPSVVKVDTYNDDNQNIRSGSGVILTSDGYIVTNYHVFNGGSKMKVSNEYLTDSYTSTSIFSSDSKRDFIIFKIDAPNLRPIKIGNSDSIRKGQMVYAIGSPFGIYVNTFTNGIISRIQKQSYESDSSNSFIQHDAPISPGNSGGALVNAKGELIGINTAVSNQQMAQNINFAIPINDILKIIHQNTLDKGVPVFNNNGSIFTQEKNFIPPKNDSANLNSGNTVNHPSNNNYGKGNCGIILWTNSSNTLDIYINNIYLGRLSTALEYNQNNIELPIYGQYGTISKVMKAGNYKIRVVNITLSNSYEGDLILKEGECNKSFVEYSAVASSKPNYQRIFLDKHGNKPINLIRLNNSSEKFYILNDGDIYVYKGNRAYLHCSKKEPPSFNYKNGKTWIWSFKRYISGNKYKTYDISTDGEVWAMGSNGIFKQYGILTHIDY